MLNYECYECTDFFEEDAICYVCYQQMKKRIEKLEADIARLKSEDEPPGAA